MSADPKATALRAAAKHGTPYVTREGPLVVLVLDGTRNDVTGELRGTVCTWMCSSSGIARYVERWALTLLVTLRPEQDPLAVGALYAEAAYRHAMRRRGGWRAA